MENGYSYSSYSGYSGYGKDRADGRERGFSVWVLTFIALAAMEALFRVFTAGFGETALSGAGHPHFPAGLRLAGLAAVFSAQPAAADRADSIYHSHEPVNRPFPFPGGVLSDICYILHLLFVPERSAGDRIHGHDLGCDLERQIPAAGAAGSRRGGDHSDLAPGTAASEPTPAAAGGGGSSVPAFSGPFPPDQLRGD